ncbi:unnamed protein product [Arabis nemorensis]|uniref:Uncharacterized protein n=1 Tax=Arabis nemorensis TaxID=586526 RepID=A0A565BYD9_9BRAS|nr:unnamed protein product [Arabis nemorensis]
MSSPRCQRGSRGLLCHVSSSLRLGSSSTNLTWASFPNHDGLKSFTSACPFTWATLLNTSAARFCLFTSAAVPRLTSAAVFSPPRFHLESNLASTLPPRFYLDKSSSTPRRCLPLGSI